MFVSFETRFTARYLQTEIGMDAGITGCVQILWDGFYLEEKTKMNARQHDRLQWKVESEKDPNKEYLVDLEYPPQCDCRDYQINRRNHVGYDRYCKHIRFVLQIQCLEFLKQIRDQTK